ncbi:hypothetical protein AYJ54_17685, partial [Bradyrhizobium centrolobii]
MFDAIDTAFDEIAMLVGLTIVFDLDRAVRSRRDHSLDATLYKISTNSVAVVAFIAEKLSGIDVVKLHQCFVGINFVDLAASDVEGQRVAFGIGADVDLRREATARAAERFLILIPPFTPAACWCARMMVESMACSSSAGGPRLAKVSNAASQTPDLLQRVKRMKTEFHLPYRSGMSRHGTPVRRTHRMPLTVRRLSRIGGPRSPRSGN